MIVAALACLAALLFAGTGPAARNALSPNVTVIAGGLNNLRGLTFGPDGNL